MASRHNARVKQAAEEGGVGKFLYDYIGKPFLDMDEGFSGRIQGNINDPESQRNVLEAAPLRDIMRDYSDRDARIKKAEEYYKDRPEGYGGNFIDFNAHKFQNMMNAGLFGAANMGVRYGLPAAGVTLAGKGLYDLTIAFGGGADYQEQGQLPLG